jgi:hypothetical protein
MDTQLLRRMIMMAEHDNTKAYDAGFVAGKLDTLVHIAAICKKEAMRAVSGDDFDKSVKDVLWCDEYNLAFVDGQVEITEDEEKGIVTASVTEPS